MPATLSTQRKRINVNVENHDIEIPEARRNQYVPDPLIKASCLTAAIHAQVQLCVYFDCLSEGRNLTTTMQITSILNTAHHILRQHANQAQGKVSEKVTNFQVRLSTGAVIVKPRDEVLAIVMLVFKAYNLEYAHVQGSPPPWIGTMGPLITFQALFKHRMDEVRTGTTKFQVGVNAQGVPRDASIGQYSLNNSHAIHLEGLTYPPMKCSSVAQSIGPVAQLLKLHTSRKNPVYAERWKRAAAKSLAHLKHSAEIIEMVSGTEAKAAGPYIQKVADILTITGSRASIKAYFPFAFYLSTLTKNELDLMSAKPLTPTGEDKDLAYTKVTVVSFKDITHSGHGAFNFYNRATQGAGFSIHMNATEEQIQQIVFHSVFGSHLEDLHICEYMTGVRFFRRSELGNCFRGKGTAPNNKFKLLKVNKWAKLSQALTTSMTSGGQQQIFHRTTFSGKRTTNIGAVFREHFSRTKRGEIQAGIGQPHLYAKLSNTFKVYLEEVKKAGFIEQGVMDWRNTDFSAENPMGTLCQGPPRNEPKLFLASGEEASFADVEDMND